PNGTYAYFATVDENWNSAYPYAVGPTFYGSASNRSVNSINEPTTVYNPTTSISEEEFSKLDITVFPNPASDLLAIQINDLVSEDFTVELLDINGRLVRKTTIKRGSTIAYFDTESIYSGAYLVRISSQNQSVSKKVIVTK
ncbi:MAG: T9SS type A sorting domain-containing protein, partial [Bacteroidota bacterium]